MGFTLPRVSNSTGAAIPVGLYVVSLKAMEQEHREDGPYGPQDRCKWIFTIEEVIDSNDPDAESKVGEELWAFTSVSMGKKATMRTYVEALLGKPLEEDDEITTEDVIGKRAKANVVPHTKQDGTQTTKVGSLLPARTAKRRQPDKDEDEGALF